MSSGGDLDGVLVLHLLLHVSPKPPGDKFFVSWDADIVPPIDAEVSHYDQQIIHSDNHSTVLRLSAWQGIQKL